MLLINLLSKSATGPDAIDYSVFKLVPKAAADFFSSINQVITDCSRVPHKTYF